MKITGAVLLGFADRFGEARFAAIDPATGEAIGPDFNEAGVVDVADAAALADRAFALFSETSLEARALFLETIAEEIANIGDMLIERAMRESGLPRARLEGERGRTIGQLRLFASIVREGGWIDVTIDPAIPDRAPLPRPDLRRRNVALGPVAVFGASNFPLAFSVAGGDTASALAAGCPVIVKGHPAHPGTGELVARAIRRAVEQCGLPEGVFSYLPGTTHALGAALVADPRIQAVGFTGSRGGGLALVRIASERAEPIPVYAEMSSINPVILFPAAAKARGAALGEAYAASLTMGAGQFCTNPGLVIALDGSDLDAFVASAATALGQSPAQQMLTPAIHSAFRRGVDALSANDAVETIARGPAGEGENEAQAALFGTDAAAFARDAALGEEIFGSSSIVVRAADPAEIAQLVGGLEGQLTATLLFDEADEDLVAPLIPLLARKVGRILANGWPTGVEVCHAMVHGGPFPATSDSRTTSVGALAIMRFLRPVCYQNLPDRLLPTALRQDNPYGVARRIDGVLTLG
ncbi:aldehyde dehydrogenase (NADP(+)) [Sphingopyxis fribergensis]